MVSATVGHMLEQRYVPRLSIALSILICTALGCGKGPNDPSAMFSVSAVFPTSGAADYVNEITISGVGFEPGATVTVGGAATDVHVWNSRTITALTPIHSVGTVDVVVTNPSGQSGRLTSAYTYSGFSVTAVTPKRGLTGDVLRILGTGFSTNAAVTIDGMTVGTIQPTSTQLMIIAPARPPGPVEITVTNPDGRRGALPQSFTYETVALSASPATVKAASQLSVTWGAPPGRPGADWVALYLVDTPNNDSYVWWQYTSGRTQATVTLIAPGMPGDYEFRYFADDGYVDAARSGIVTVIPPAGAPADARTSSAGLPSPAFPLIRLRLGGKR
jgi:hypothetical protein